MEILEELKFFWTTKEPAGSAPAGSMSRFFAARIARVHPCGDLHRDGFVTVAQPASSAGWRFLACNISYFLLFQK
ncbi:hypothetical protein [Comamonas endophytica]|uniref:Uncharacterized protein n=1 Tax=Comamonas endophytica TaxID=2949090 RepID=A0ABY6G8Y3_9BURK|nr:hypothetical protein [Acidovorax sp. 5MLIR]UYG51493.1 hypothetical protein M9799_15775 [Acidovorax sp. 5MLIR]